MEKNPIPATINYKPDLKVWLEEQRIHQLKVLNVLMIPLPLSRNPKHISNIFLQKIIINDTVWQ